MKKLRMAVEELSVETFDVDASPRGRGTVAARDAESQDTQCKNCPSFATCDLADNICFPPSQTPDEAACYFPTPNQPCESDGLICG